MSKRVIVVTTFSLHNGFIFVMPCYAIIIIFFKWGCSRLGGCRVLRSLIEVFMYKKSRYGETLNKIISKQKHIY